MMPETASPPAAPLREGWWHIYDGVRRVRLAKCPDWHSANRWCDARPRRYLRLWNDGTGEEWERKGGEWRRTAAPEAAPAGDPNETRPAKAPA